MSGWSTNGSSASGTRTGVARQALLIPEIVSLGNDADRLLEMAEELETLGLVLEPFGPGTIAVRETPAILGSVNAERSCATSSTNWTMRARRPPCNPASMPCSAAWPATAPSAPVAG
jgi:hypothetical protein